MATLSGVLTGQGSGAVSVPAARPRRRSRPPMAPKLRNAYGKLPQWVAGSRTPPKYTDAQRAIINQVYARFDDPFRAFIRRGYRQHALNIANIAHATPAQIRTARRHHALGSSSIDPGPPVLDPVDMGVADVRDTAVPSAVLPVGRDVLDTSLAGAMTHGPASPTPGKPVLPAGVSARELGHLSKALTPGQRRRVGLF